MAVYFVCSEVKQAVQFPKCRKENIRKMGNLSSLFLTLKMGGSPASWSGGHVGLSSNVVKLNNLEPCPLGPLIVPPPTHFS